MKKKIQKAKIKSVTCSSFCLVEATMSGVLASRLRGWRTAGLELGCSLLLGATLAAPCASDTRHTSTFIVIVTKQVIQHISLALTLQIDKMSEVKIIPQSEFCFLYPLTLNSLHIELTQQMWSATLNSRWKRALVHILVVKARTTCSYVGSRSIQAESSKGI